MLAEDGNGCLVLQRDIKTCRCNPGASISRQCDLKPLIDPICQGGKPAVRNLNLWRSFVGICVVGIDLIRQGDKFSNNSCAITSLH